MEKTSKDRIRIRLASTVMGREVSYAESAGVLVVDRVGEVTIRLYLSGETGEETQLCEQRTLEVAPPVDKMYEITEVELEGVTVDSGVAEVSINVYYNRY